MVVYPAGPVPLAAPSAVTMGAHKQRPSIPEIPPPRSPLQQRPRSTQETTCRPTSSSSRFTHRTNPRTSECAFSNAMKLHGGSVISPVVPPTSHLLSPLQSSSSGSSLYLQVRYCAHVLFRELKYPVTDYDFTRFTTELPTPYMKLYHLRLPWYIKVTMTNGVSVTFHDFFMHIQHMLSSRIKNSDFYNNELTQEVCENISRAWKEHCQYNQGAVSQAWVGFG